MRAIDRRYTVRILPDEELAIDPVNPAPIERPKPPKRGFFDGHVMRYQAHYYDHLNLLNPT
jgi:hypothetical protein